MSISYIPEKTKLLLWGKAAGRCQYRGCNDCLFRDDLTQAEFNQAYIAHIIADKKDGPRGDEILSPKLKSDLSNLMLLCDKHHRLVDKDDVVGHPAVLLLQMKKEHEERIERTTAIAQNMQSHIVLYRANIGDHSPQLTYESVRGYLLPEYHPATNFAIDLGMCNSIMRDKNAIFWKTELENLTGQFQEQIKPKLRKGEIKHLSIFGFAPIPLLIKLGTLINDIQNVEVFQPIRDPKTWKWQVDKNHADIFYRIIEPKETHPKVALNISLSGTIANNRIYKILGNEVSVYTLTVDKPFNDLMKCKKHLLGYSREIRLLFDKIKSIYGSETPIHLFPAIPISAAIELGRIWMPKADMSLEIYDQNTANDGFTIALQIFNN